MTGDVRCDPLGSLDTNAVRAAVEAAEAHGVEVTDPDVLHVGYNVVAWLKPAPIVARVHTTTALLRPGLGELVEREVATVEHLAQRGIPTVRPSEAIPAGPHVHNGLMLSMWQHMPTEPATPEPTDAAHALRDLHRALEELPTSTGLIPALSDIETYLRTSARFTALSPEQNRTVAELRDELAPCMDEAPRQLHGDAHPGNLLRAGTQWTWFDFEESGVGPVGWDLAALAQSTRLDGTAAVRAYGIDDPATLAPFQRLRTLWGAVWCAAHAERNPDFGAHATTLLASLSNRNSLAP